MECYYGGLDRRSRRDTRGNRMETGESGMICGVAGHVMVRGGVSGAKLGELTSQQEVIRERLRKKVACAKALRHL